MTKVVRFFAVIILLATFGCQDQSPREKKVLVFSKTEGFRHESIPAGIQAIKDLGEKEGFKVDATEDADHFIEENLQQYATVVFLNTTQDVLNVQQQSHFERYIQAGGGFVGIHAAADTEYDWPWYGKLVGAYFESHPNNPNVRSAMCHVVDHGHTSTDSLPDSFQKVDEFYNFYHINPDINVLITIDESTYEGGTNGDEHPMTWYHQFDGGRAFYTAFGHTEETFSEPEFIQILNGGLRYAMGENQPLNYDLARYQPMPEENRFSKVQLDFNLNEPTELQVLPDGRVLFLERKGAVKLYKPDLDSTLVISNFDVYYGPGTRPRHEDGMLGLALDPNFSENQWVYIYYSPNIDKPVQYLSRFEMSGDELLMDSEIVMLEVDVQREQCCHTGGSIAFGPDGNLFLSTGDDTNPFESDGFSPSDERPGRSPWDAQGSSANTNDLRGKILRITPQPDGSYTIPDGNLFPEGTEGTRPEIYVMGCRNPYRIAVDQRTGYLYWGDVGPDAGEMSETRGPWGIDEFNQAREAGFYGWPYFTANNLAYSEYDFATETAGAFHNPQNPINNSPNNTGIETLPPAQPAMIYYSYGVSEEWPLLGNGGKNAMAGPIYYGDQYPDHEHKYPEYFSGKPLFFEWMRGDMYLLTMDSAGDLEKIEPILTNLEFSNPMDVDYGPDGKMYLLEYGSRWFSQNLDARLVRIDYDAGNRAPIARFTAEPVIGAAPLTVEFNAETSEDYDRDEMTFSWDFGSGANSDQIQASHTFNESGTYTVKLTVQDDQGNASTETQEISVGNDPPEVTIAIEGNETFFWDNRKVAYKVTVNDQEDGSTEVGTISSDEVSVQMEYLEKASKEAILGHQSNDELQHSLTGSRLIADSDCKACHALDNTSIGPSYMEVAKKYKDDPEALNYLSDKIIKGGGGVWGENVMAAHPAISKEDATEMVKYILSLTQESKAAELALQGEFSTVEHIGKAPGGAYFITASYSDKGSGEIKSASGREVLTLRNPNMAVTHYDSGEDVQVSSFEDVEYVQFGNPSMVVFNQIDLSGVNSLILTGTNQESPTYIELRLDDPNGEPVATASLQTTSTEVYPGVFSAQAVMNLTEVSGKHNLYFRVSSEGAQVGGIQMISFQIDANHSRVVP